jgi:hypothetical protein
VGESLIIVNYFVLDVILFMMCWSGSRSVYVRKVYMCLCWRCKVLAWTVWIPHEP